MTGQALYPEIAKALFNSLVLTPLTLQGRQGRWYEASLVFDHSSHMDSPVSSNLYQKSEFHHDASV